MELNTLLLGDVLDALKELEDNSVDSIVTDAPYGLGEEPDPVEVMQDWIKQGYHEIKSKSGFMGKSWDAFVPQPIVWKECYRVLKPGGHLLSFFGTRTIDWGVIALRFAGFEVRDCICWLYGQGFPKSLDLEKATENENYKGVGTGLKPAMEPIILCRKPISEKTIAANVLKWGTGGINIDDCRIEYNGKTDPLTFGGSWKTNKMAKDVYEGGYRGEDQTVSSTGRFPSNVILECTCNEVIESGEARQPYEYKENEYEVEGFIHNIKPNSPSNYNDLNLKHIHTNPDCPCYILDHQSGELKSGFMRKDQQRHQDGGYHGGFPQDRTGAKDTYGDSGTASRFFYQAKASRKERNIGCEDLKTEVKVGHNRFDKCKNCGGYLLQNHDRKSACKCEAPEREDNYMTGNYHPTVKPLQLMRYLVRLVTPKNGICLDPYIGSGTTAMACVLEDINFIGIDNDEGYINLASARIAAVAEQKDKIKETA
jgi:site-specific DNA-methyltransferase (adenine-specific)